MRIRMQAAAVAVLAALVVSVVTACSPDPAPTPTPTSFANEDEAFAAAEATYRAYIDAENAARDGESSLPTPQSFLIDQALQDDIDAGQQLASAGVHIEGPSRVASIEAGESVRTDVIDEVVLSVCLDPSASLVINELGEDVTPPARPVTPLTVTLRIVGSKLMITDSVLREETC